MSFSLSAISFSNTGNYPVNSEEQLACKELARELYPPDRSMMYSYELTRVADAIKKLLEADRKDIVNLVRKLVTPESGVDNVLTTLRLISKIKPDEREIFIQQAFDLGLEKIDRTQRTSFLEFFAKLNAIQQANLVKFAPRFIAGVDSFTQREIMRILAQTDPIDLEDFSEQAIKLGALDTNFGPDRIFILSIFAKLQHERREAFVHEAGQKGILDMDQNDRTVLLLNLLDIYDMTSPASIKSPSDSKSPPSIPRFGSFSQAFFSINLLAS